jgi:tetratricopeptide (TPR) repeat protein
MAPLPTLPNSGRLATALKARQDETETGTKTEGGTLTPSTVLRITSFAEGVKAAGLRDLLSRAETSMRDGRFTAALDNYDAAIAVAPNNPLLLIARANAELGAGYYARAQTHIEQTFAADSSLLLAQYDLRVFYGPERLQYLVRDLKDVAQTESGQARPLFLLAYIAYNTNNPQSAADYLAMAERRGGKDPVFDKLRTFWKLPAPTAGDGMPQNK